MTDAPTPAIFFHPDAVEADGKDLVGRRSAGQSFVRAFLQHVDADQINAVVETKAHADAFDAFARSAGETRKIEVAVLRMQQDYARFGAIFCPTPGFQSMAWRRARTDQRSCSLIGVTHTVSTRRIIESLHTQLIEPIQPWDAIICTSNAVQSVLKRQFALESEYLRARFGATRVPQPQLPVIPLGIHTAEFTPEPDQRATLRARYDVPEDGVVVMTMGRLTSVEKANPVPLFMALERIAQARKVPIHLWITGWSSRDGETKLHQDGAAELCPSVTVHFIDGRDPEVRRHIWSGADIFTLPVDNIQETFGLVPVEAMAAGLPVVMPDWNGFRDTVVDGETGYLIPTMTPAADQPEGPVIAARFADGRDDYLRYLSIVQQQTVIDVGAYTQALDTLVADADKRQAMGHAGQAHVCTRFDWAQVIPQYLQLADDLSRMRDRVAPVPTVQNPMEASPFDMYAGYPTSAIKPTTVIRPVRVLDKDGLAALDQLNGRTLYNRKIAKDEKVLHVADVIMQSGPITCEDLHAQIGATENTLVGIILFLAKYDFVTLAPQVSK